MIVPVPSEVLVDHWNEVKPWLRDVYEEVGYDENGILMELLSKNMQLWRGEDFACVTQINIYPKWRVASILFLGGENMKDWLEDLHEVLEPWAKAEGCKYLEGYGRVGWTRALAPYGWKSSYIGRKELDNGQ